MMTNKVVKKSKRSNTSSDDSKSGEETKKQKIRCLNQCNLDGRNVEGKLVENDPTFVVSKRPTPESDTVSCEMIYCIDVEERRIKSHTAVVFSTLVARNIGKATKGQFPRAAVEPEAARQDVEVALNESMKVHVSIDDMQLFACEVIDKNLEKSADKCHEPERNSRRNRT